MTKEPNVLGEVLQLYMDRAGISSPTELAEKVRARGIDLSEKELIELMYVEMYDPDSPTIGPFMKAGLDKMLGLDWEETKCVHEAWLRVPQSRSDVSEVLWWTNRAMARKSEITPPEELTPEELFSEERLWGKAYQRIADTRYLLERRWAFGEDGEQIVGDLRRLEESILSLKRSVVQLRAQAG